jgi:hypothetical protein
MAGQVFRVTWRNWINQVVVPLAVFAAVAAIFIAILAPKSKSVCAVLIGVNIYIWLSRLPKLWRMRLEVDDEGISGRLDKTGFDYLWPDIVSVWRTTEGKQVVLNVATDGSSVKIPLGLFRPQLRSILQSYLPPESLKDDSYKRLPGYEAWLSEQNELVWNTWRPLCAGATTFTVVAWALLIVFAGLTAFAFLGPPLEYAWLAVIPGLLLLLIMFNLLSTGPIKVDSEGAALVNPLGRFYMKWEDVKAIETDGRGRTIVLKGVRKCLRLPGPGYWLGEDKADLVDFFMAQVTERGIPVRETRKALIRWCRNTRVRARRRQALG